MLIGHGVHLIQSTSNTNGNLHLPVNLGKRNIRLVIGGGRKSHLDGYELILEEENQISQAEVEAVFEEEDDF